MNITKFDCLGDIVAFKSNEVQILSDLYDAIPTEFQSDFEHVCVNACDSYHDLVDQAKKNGEKVTPVTFKKMAIESIINPFLDRFNLTNYQKSRRVVKSTNPGIPKDSKPRVERKSPLVDMEIVGSEVSDLFDNFDWNEAIPTTITELPETPEIDFGFGELFEDEDALDLEGLGF